MQCWPTRHCWAGITMTTTLKVVDTSMATSRQFCICLKQFQTWLKIINVIENDVELNYCRYINNMKDIMIPCQSQTTSTLTFSETARTVPVLERQISVESTSLLNTIKYDEGLPQHRRYKDWIKDDGQASWNPEDDRSGTVGDKACR